MRWAMLVLSWGLVSSCHGGGAARPPCPPASAPSKTPTSEAQAPAPRLSDDAIRIATFNIRVFGKTKRGKPEVMNVLVDTVRKYDLVAIQEIKEKSGDTPPAFLERINERDGSDYGMRVSPRTGATASSHEKEQYAYYYDEQTIEPMGEGALYPDPDDRFAREPWIARFRAAGGNFSFVLIDIHTRPKAAVEEVGALHEATEWARARHPDEDDFIALGDFNASCDYASPEQLDPLAIRGEGYNWIVPDDADTNLADADCAYDRIAMTTGANGDYTGYWGVDRSFTDDSVSDHFPVWAAFYANRDGKTTCCKRCVVGKPCGNACIATRATCHAPPGCACDGS